MSSTRIPAQELAGPPSVPATGSASLRGEFRKQIIAQGQEFVLEVTFEIPSGFTILFGASGAGKTTLLDCIAGLTKPNSGTISIGERVLFDSSRSVDLAASKRRAGYVFQDLALFPHMTVEQNVAYGLAHLPHAERDTSNGLRF